jgi:glycosyltransferase involved in cell wall biosynthesis
MSKISVIISCYNEEKAIPLFYEEIEKNIKDFENTEV